MARNTIREAKHIKFTTQLPGAARRCRDILGSSPQTQCPAVLGVTVSHAGDSEALSLGLDVISKIGGLRILASDSLVAVRGAEGLPKAYHTGMHIISS